MIYSLFFFNMLLENNNRLNVYNKNDFDIKVNVLKSNFLKNYNNIKRKRSFGLLNIYRRRSFR